ncbi:hypothetical protein [Stenotrophomonas maltophilia]|jgi:hypothetical protein|uniref:hypothetical protein n=1 Tax=Stenotrophomonas maltophilia TaxID=40324 RepID=UPI0015DD9C9D|nr:hypothetical protein [Stenotrophomonas maltophilia]
MSFKAPARGPFFVQKKAQSYCRSLRAGFCKSGGGKGAGDAFGARSDVRKKCGLSVAVFAFIQDFVRYSRGQNSSAIYLEFVDGQSRLPKTTKEIDMKIHHLVSDGNQAVAITQSASSGGGYAHPVKLSAIRFNVQDAEAALGELNKSGHRHEKAFEVIERWDVDARNQGPKSKFGRTLAAPVYEAQGHLKGPVIYEAKSMQEDTARALNAAAKQARLSQVLPATGGPSMIIGGEVWNPRQEAQSQAPAPAAALEPPRQRVRL